MSDTSTLEVTPEAEREGEDPTLVSVSEIEKITQGVVEEGVK